MLNSIHKISCGNVIPVLKTYKVLARVPLVIILSSCLLYLSLKRNVNPLKQARTQLKGLYT